MGKAIIPKQVPHYESRIRKYRYEVKLIGYKDGFSTVIRLIKLLKKDKLPYSVIEDDMSYTVEWRNT